MVGRALSSPHRAGGAPSGTRGYESGPRNCPARAVGAWPQLGNLLAQQDESPCSLGMPSLAM